VIIIWRLAGAIDSTAGARAPEVSLTGLDSRLKLAMLKLWLIDRLRRTGYVVDDLLLVAAVVAQRHSTPVPRAGVLFRLGVGCAPRDGPFVHRH
jgi:hypothetical protein